MKSKSFLILLLICEVCFLDLKVTGLPDESFSQENFQPGFPLNGEDVNEHEATDCGLFLVPSTIPGAGRGVVAGREYPENTIVEEARTISVTDTATTQSQLNNYVFGSGRDDFHSIIFGPGNIYNHRKPHTMERFADEEEMRDAGVSPYPYTAATVVTYVTLASISSGEEMYETYGDHWFTRFEQKKASSEGDESSVRTVGEAQTAARRMKTADMLAHGICLTDTEIRPSTVPVSGNGLFVTRDFAVGEVVTVSPALSLPKSVVDESAPDCILMNYCISSPGSDMVLFPLNYGPMINHGSGEEANVELGWYDWSPAVEALTAKYHPGATQVQDMRLADKLNMSAQELYEAPFAQLDVSYRARRPIQQGEELRLDYGDAWEAAWQEYTRKMDVWLFQQDALGVPRTDSLDSIDPAKPKFRQYIAAPEGMFPTHWVAPSHENMHVEL